MAREKATVTLDREKAATARAMLGVDSTSEAIDIALTRLIRSERLRADVAAYRSTPPTEEESRTTPLGDLSDIADDTDWAVLYADLLS
jgi:Arc/MetJ family transcription regulator